MIKKLCITVLLSALMFNLTALAKESKNMSRQEIADIKQSMQTEPEATIQDTIDDLHKKYGITNVMVLVRNFCLYTL